MAILALAINHALLLLRERALLHAFFHGRVLLMLFRSGKLSIQCMFHVCRNHAPTWRHISILCLPKSVERKGNKLTATIGTDYSDHTDTKEYDQVVVNYGTLPLDDLYIDLKPLSSNGGAVDHDALIAGTPQNIKRNSEGTFQLFRIGEA